MNLITGLSLMLSTAYALEYVEVVGKARCLDGSDAVRLSKSQCEKKAIEENHRFYSHNSLKSKCFTQATCENKRVARRWNIYAAACTGGQAWNQCASACDKTCDEPNPICTKECVARCECPPNTVLKDGQCINVKQCPATCTGGQVWNQCASACDKTCDEPNPICTKECVARCECPPNTVLKDGQCINVEQCPATCTGGQVWEQCGSACDTTCEEPNPICTKECVARCQCPSNMVLKDGQCINIDQCPECGPETLSGPEACPVYSCLPQNFFPECKLTTTYSNIGGACCANTCTYVDRSGKICEPQEVVEARDILGGW